MTTLIILVAIIVLWSVWGFFSARVEQAEYVVIKKTDSYEIREYKERIVAQTTVQGSYEDAMSAGFRIVAGYIFGGNTKKESIAMTAPVTAQSGVEKTSESIAMTAPVFFEKENDSYTISFSIPKSYTQATLPIPNDARVKVVTVPVKKYAVMRFSWYRTDARIKSMQEKLRSNLSRDGIDVLESAMYAGYNAPFTPPWMLRNEVMFEIK